MLFAACWSVTVACWQLQWHAVQSDCSLGSMPLFSKHCSLAGPIWWACEWNLCMLLLQVRCWSLRQVGKCCLRLLPPCKAEPWCMCTAAIWVLPFRYACVQSQPLVFLQSSMHCWSFLDCLCLRQHVLCRWQRTACSLIWYTMYLSHCWPTYAPCMSLWTSLVTRALMAKPDCWL